MPFNPGVAAKAAGFDSGVMADGTAWPVKGLSEGRFSNVFALNVLTLNVFALNVLAFIGELIKRVAVYVDPDFQSTHTARFL